jgi:AbrB family looped-hinge helix DNA binding protein
MFRVTLKERGQLTIPSKLRKKLMLKPGDLLEMEVKEGYIIVKPLQVVERGADSSGSQHEEPAP